MANERNASDSRKLTLVRNAWLLRRSSAGLYGGFPSTSPLSLDRVAFRNRSAEISFWKISRADAASAIRVSGGLPSSLRVSSGS